MAALYVLAGAEFLAVSQVIIYVGGILILLLFGVMLTHKLRETKPRTGIVNLLPGLLVAGSLLTGLIWGISSLDLAFPEPAQPQVEAVRGVGIATVTQFLLPFELISILLLIALVGAAFISRKIRSTPKEKRP